MGPMRATSRPGTSSIDDRHADGVVDLGSGQLTGARSDHRGVMQAVNLTTTGIEGGAGQFAVSNTGTLIYATGGVGAMASSRLEWLD